MAEKKSERNSYSGKFSFTKEVPPARVHNHESASRLFMVELDKRPGVWATYDASPSMAGTFRKAGYAAVTRSNADGVVTLWVCKNPKEE